MLNVTLDMNCIIDLEQRSTRASYLKRLIEMHSNREINLRVVAISASEKKPDGTYTSNLSEFKERIAAVGLADVEILRTLKRWGLAFWGYSLWSGGALNKLERDIQTILFPTIELEFKDFCEKRCIDLENHKAWQDWVNAKCDVLALWSHIWYDGDIFITTDYNFHKKTKKPKLIELGAKEILTPTGALKFLLARAVQKIERALARAKQYKIVALRKIKEVEIKANQAIALLRDCPAPDPGMIQPIWLLHRIGGLSASHYLLGRFGSCDHYPTNAEIAEDNTKRHLDNVERTLSEVNEVKNHINSRCSSASARGLSDSDKSSLQNTLSSLMNYAQAEGNKFDRSIDDIKKFLEDYKECIENTPHIDAH